MSYRIYTVGIIRRNASGAVLELDPAFLDALRGLDGFSHVVILYWFDRNDTPEQRRTLLVHPGNDPGNPLTGVFATRSPRRPNLPGMDLEPYIPVSDAFPEAEVPGWVPGSGDAHDG